MKAERVQVTSLPRRTTREVVAVPWEDTQPVSSEATVYASLSSNTPAPAGVVGVQLVAGCMGHRFAVAAAGIPPGFDGIAMVVSGIVADAWHVEAWGGGSDVDFAATLAIRQCCSGLNVEVPAELQNNIPDLQGMAARVHPLIRERGFWRLASGQGDATVSLDRGDRILRVEMHASNQDATLDGLPGGQWIVQAMERGEIFPRGNVAGPRDLVFADTDHYVVEIVR